MLINELGRFNPSRECRTFSATPKSFYKLNDIEVDYSSQHQLAVSNSFLHSEHEVSQIEDALRTIKGCIKDNKNYCNLYQATAIPFCLSLPETMPDVGTQLEENWLPSLKLHYEKQVQGGYFKATLQGHTKLSKHLTVVKGSGYKTFSRATIELNCCWILLSNSLPRIRHKFATRKNFKFASNKKLNAMSLWPH